MLEVSADALLDAAEAAELQRVKPSTVETSSRHKRIPAHKIGRSLPFLRAELLLWIAEQPAESPCLSIFEDEATGSRSPALARRRLEKAPGTAVSKEAQEYHDKRVAELWRVRTLGERPRVGLYDAIGTWLVEHAVKKRSYEDDRLRVRTMLEVLHDIPTDRVTTAILTRLRRDIINRRGCSSTTANRYLELIYAVLHYERRQDRLQYFPAIPYAKETPATPPILTPEEAKRLRAANAPFSVGPLRARYGLERIQCAHARMGPGRSAT